MSTELPSMESLMKIIMIKNDLIWNNLLSSERINQWLSNFKGEILGKTSYEQHLALWLLTNFVYYNLPEIRHLCRYLFLRFVHHHMSSCGSCETFQEIVKTSRFLPLGNPGESGSLLSYFFRQQNDLPKSCFPSVHKVPNDTKQIVFIDDVVLSGKQSKRYLSRIAPLFKGKLIYLLTLFSTEKAIDDLKTSLGIQVISCANLDDRCKCFSNSSSIFDNFKDHLEPCRIMAEGYGKKIFPKHPLGCDDGQYTFGFFYNTPNNSLPIFWVDNTEWIPLFKRYHKKYKGEVSPFDKTFI